MKKFVSGAVATFAALIAASTIQAATYIGDGTLSSANDLTRIDDGGSVFEFLDLTATAGMKAADAEAAYAGNGFSLATYADVTRLLDAFGFVAPTLPGLGARVGFSGGDDAGFIAALGDTYGNAAFASFDNGAGSTGYLCISMGTCSPQNFVYTYGGFDGHYALGALLVRSAPTSQPIVNRVAPTVPVPAALPLLLTGVGGLAFLAKRRKSA